MVNEPLEPDAIESTSDERNLAMLMHISAPFFGFWGPLIIWLVKKDTSPFIDQHGREALNFQISIFLYSLPLFCVGGVLTLVTMGFGGLLFIPLGLILFGFILVGCVISARQASSGEVCCYPLTVRLLK